MDESDVSETTEGRDIGKIYYSSSRSIAEVSTSSRSISKLPTEEPEGAASDNYLMIPRHSSARFRRQRSKSENPPEFDEQDEIKNSNSLKAKFYLDGDKS